MTGSTPGMPKQIGQTWVFGGAPAYSAEQPQNILLAVRSWEWTSSPMTASYFVPAGGGALTMFLARRPAASRPPGPAFEYIRGSAPPWLAPRAQVLGSEGPPRHAIHAYRSGETSVGIRIVDFSSAR